MKYLAHISEDGKREQTVDDHLKNTAKLAEQFASVFNAESWGYCAGIVHDVGKGSKEFQQRLQGGPKVDHSTAGMKLLINKKGYYLNLAPCVAGHHSGMPDWGTEADCAGDSGSVCARIKKDIPDCSNYSRTVKVPELKPPVIKPVGKGGFSVSFFVRMIFSCLVDADFLDTEKFMQNGKVNRESGVVTKELLNRLLEYVEPWLKNKETNENTVNGHRTEILKVALERGKDKSGVYTMTVPTGGGKTISSMAFALQHAVKNEMKRIIYVIPYTSIIEQNAKVFREILGEENVLEHHSNVDYGDEDEFKPTQLATENWDKPIIVTTNVQFFESLYSNKPSKCRKLHNMANSVIIFDEAQKLPTQYLIPCVRAMEELNVNYGCTILLCTATQPSLKKFFSEGTEFHEICPNVEEQFQFFKRSNIENTESLTEEKLAEILKKEKQVLCICNSRKRAQKIYKLIADGTKESCEKTNIYHLSTLMYPAHRLRILNKVREKLITGERCILIATSLVEAGVDLDFQTVYREIAGVDSVVQAAGRCNREGKRPLSESKTYVFTFAENVGNPRELNQPIAVTKNIRDRFSDIGSLEAIEEYFMQMHHIKGNNLDQKGIIGQFESESQRGHYPYKTVAGEFKLIEADSKTILINENEKTDEMINRLKCGEYSRQLMRKVQQYGVQVYQNDFDKIYSAGMLEFIDGENGELAVLRDTENNYSEETGLKIDVNTGEGIIW